MVKDNARVAGIILAAGSSRRMGTPKQLLPVAGVVLIERVVDAALNSGLDQVIVVLGHRADEIRECLRNKTKDPRLSIAINEAFEEGMASSIIRGLEEAADQSDHVMIILGDMPFVTSAAIDRLLGGYLASGCPLGALAISGRRSHPAVFSKALFAELFSLHGDRGAREVFDRHMDCAFLMEPETGFDDRDIDTEEDYRAIEGAK